MVVSWNIRWGKSSSAVRGGFVTQMFLCATGADLCETECVLVETKSGKLGVSFNSRDGEEPFVFEQMAHGALKTRRKSLR